MHFLHQDLLDLPKIQRLNLVNSLVGYKSANLVGTVSKKGISNLAIFSSVIHLGSNPPLIGFITRPTVVDRHTYQNIKDIGFYTINSVHKEIIKGAHQTSAKYKEEESEFETCGFSEYHSDHLAVPYVLESPVKVGLSYVEEHLIAANKTIMVVGKIEELIIPDDNLGKDGFLDLSQSEIVTISGLDSYMLPQKIARYEYARPDKPLNTLD